MELKIDYEQEKNRGLVEGRNSCEAVSKISGKDRLDILDDDDSQPYLWWKLRLRISEIDRENWHVRGEDVGSQPCLWGELRQESQRDRDN